MARLTALPEELVSNIAQRLGSDDLFSLRLSCKTLSEKSFHDFATEYFSEKCVMFTSESLGVLVSISEHRKLRKYLHKVFVLTALFSEQAFTVCDCYQPTIRQSEAYKFLIGDQQKLKSSAEDCGMLKRALSRLPAVRTIGMVDGLRHLGTSTNCWGINKIMRQTGTRPLVATDPERTDKTYLRNVHHIWAALASAIAFSRVKTLRAIETRFVYSMNGLFLESIANVGKPAVLRSVAPVLKGLTKLELSIRGRTYSLNGSTNQKALKTSQKYLQDFVRRLHGLKELDLSFDSSGQSGTIFNIFASGLRLEQLTTVKLHSLNVNDVAFANSIEGMIAVRDLHLLWVNITKGTWIPILKAIKTLPKLHHLHLMYSQEKGRKVFFLAQEDAPEENESMPDGDLDEDEEEDYEDYDEEDGTDTTDTDEADGTNATEVHLNEHSHHDLEDETGYYFCLKGKEIREKIPTFIAEYSVGGLARDPLSGFAFALPIPLGFTIPQTLGAGVIGPVAATGNTGGAGNGVGSATAVVSSTAAVAGAIGGGDNYDSDDDVPDLVEEFE